MIVLLLAALLAAAPTRPPQALPPADWATLPPLGLVRTTETTPEMTAFVRTEVLQHRCTAAVHQGAGWRLTVDVAVLLAPDGQVRRIMPRAIQCPTVEQYAVGLVSSMIRGNAVPLPGDSDRWYRTTLSFYWAA